MQLTRYKQQLRHLVKQQSSLESKSKYITQHGGFLPFLAPLIPLIIKAATIAGPIIAKGALAGVAGTTASIAAKKVIDSASK